MNGYSFTERTRRVLAIAREQAAMLHHDYIGTEHILLAIIAEGGGIGAAVLRNLGADVQSLAKHVKELAGLGRSTWTTGPDLPYRPGAKRVLELAMKEARERHHNYVGTEHLLLGLLREGRGTAARAMGEAGIGLEAARAEALRLLRAEAEGEKPTPPSVWLDGPAGRRIDRVEISLRFHDGEVRQRSFATPREAAEYLWRGAVP